MSDKRDFAFYCERDLLKVKFVSARTLGHDPQGHQIYGSYRAKVIELPRNETLKSQRALFWHEFGHYAYDRSELQKGDPEESVVDILTWAPVIMEDPRNKRLLAFLGLREAR